MGILRGIDFICGREVVIKPVLELGELVAGFRGSHQFGKVGMERAAGAKPPLHKIITEGGESRRAG